MAKTKSDTPDMGTEARITLGLLNVVQDNARVSQRSIASDLGIALGLANAYLKRCVKKGLVKVSQAPANRYAYYLTPQGFAEKSRLTAEFLSQSLNLFRHARSEGAELFERCQNRGWTRVALLGAGDLADIMTLSARDYAVELVALVDPDFERDDYAGLPVVPEIRCPGDVDAVILCNIVQPQRVYDRACASIPEERVLAPRFLRIGRNAEAEAAGEGSER